MTTAKTADPSIVRLEAENFHLKKRNAAFEGKNPTKRLDRPNSVQSEEQRQANTKKVRKKKRGKMPKRRDRLNTCE